ncbi:MAG: tRNA-intron lyase, partial [Candidatus Micrarchaeota archaeon]|nr:tRNA-intron lyase [Candidatus Micrarchaeota archaeon]
QFGTYKAKKHGQFLKLDAYEALFLSKHASLKLDVPRKKVLEAAVLRRPDFLALYDVYEDWRLRGFVPKTGFKFGTHFRLYFPGAAPGQSGQWMHSRHVIHVFSRDSKMLISEWARAIRVAHGVKKTFILSIPGEKIKAQKTALDFLLYHRKGEGIETPRKDDPSFAMLAFSEEEEIGGQELAEAIAASAGMGLDLMLAICDRETAVTYYRVKRIDLPKSKYEYYEIEWVQP